MNATPEYYEHIVTAFPDTEQLTVLTVAGSSRNQVAATLGADLTTTVDPWDVEITEGQTAWALLEVPGGVLGVERSGFGDPSLEALQELSRHGAAAVVRSNILAHLRFGCARAGEVLFDADEYMYIEDPEVVPTELRTLFDLAWEDLESEVDELADGPNPYTVAFAMAEQATGVTLTADQASEIFNATFHPSPAMQYAGSDE